MEEESFCSSDSVYEEIWKNDELYSLLFEQSFVLKFDAQSIMSRFANSYREVFCISKKCHFDALPSTWDDEDRVVDGARSKWCSPLLLDALITFLDVDSFDLSHRRTFNQHKILHECIHAELQDQYEDIYDLLVARKTSMGRRASPNVTCMAVSPSPSPVQWFPFLPLVGDPDTEAPFLEVHNLSSPWTDIMALKHSMLAGPASKSRDKLVSIVSWLCSHPSLQKLDMDLHRAFKVVIFKALFLYPQPTPRTMPILSTRARKKARSMPTLQLLLPGSSPCPSSASTSASNSSPRSTALYAPLSFPSPTPVRQHRYALREIASRDPRDSSKLQTSHRHFRPIRSDPDLAALHLANAEDATMQADDAMSEEVEDPEDDGRRRRAGKKRGGGRVGRKPRSPPNQSAHFVREVISPAATRLRRAKRKGEMSMADDVAVSAEIEHEVDNIFASLCEQIDGSSESSDDFRMKEWELIPAASWDEEVFCCGTSPQPQMQLPPQRPASAGGFCMELWEWMDQQCDKDNDNHQVV